MKHKRILNILLSILICASVSTAAAVADWSTFHHDAQRSGYTDSSGLGTYELGAIWYFQPGVSIVDNTDVDTTQSKFFQSTPGWVTSSVIQNSYGIDKNYMSMSTVLGNPTDTATWTFNLTDSEQTKAGWSARYRMYVWAPSSASFPWSPLTTYAVGDYALPTSGNANGHIYMCTVAGTSGTVEPAWPVGGSVGDGTVTWTDAGVSNVSQTTDAHYSVVIGGNVYTCLPIDQTTGGGWVKLEYGNSNDPSDSFIINGGDSVQVKLTNQSATAGAMVAADAVKIERDGIVLSSPVSSPTKSLLVTSVTQTFETPQSIWQSVQAHNVGDVVVPVMSNGHKYRCVTAGTSAVTEPLWISFDADGNTVSPVIDGTVQWIDAGTLDESSAKGVVYGVNTEKSTDITLPDTRGTKVWQFPSDSANWIEGSISSTPAIFTPSASISFDNGDVLAAGTELAVAAGGDGQVYAISTADGNLAWQGPGWIVDDNAASFNGGWVSPVLHAGYQGVGYKQDLVASTGSDTAKWSWNVNIAKPRSYTLYAWIPMSSASEKYISDASYSINYSFGSVNNGKFVAQIDQSAGGRWVRLGNFATPVSSGNLKVDVTLTNKSGLTAANYRVAADAIKLVPTDLGTVEFSSPVVTADGTIIVGSTSGRVYAYKIGNQEPVWTWPNPNDSTSYPVGAIYASPALSVDQSTVYIGASSGHVYALNTSDGTQRWAFPKYDSKSTTNFVLGSVSSTTAVGDYIYVATGGSPSDSWTGAVKSGKVIALNADGTMAWQYPSADTESLGSFMYSSPLLMKLSSDATPSVFAASTDGYLYGINSSGTSLTGSGKWAAFPDILDTAYSSPAGVTLSNLSYAYMGTESGLVYGISLETGEKVWFNDLLGSATSSPAIHDGRMYIGDTRGYTWGFSGRNGSNGSGEAEGWNTSIEPTPPTTGSTDAGIGRTATPDVDVFTAGEYATIKAALDAHTDPGDLHQRAFGSTIFDHGNTPIHIEWGDQVYFIAWNLLNPNYNSATAKYNWDTASTGFKQKANGKVTLTFKSRAPGDAADSSDNQNMVQGGYYNTSDGKQIFYAVYTFDLGVATRSKPLTPGSDITVTVKEVPSVGAKDVSGTSVVPRNYDTATVMSPVDPIDPARKNPATFLAQSFSINNPLALAYGSSVVGVTNANGSTSRTGNDVGVNGNDGNVPVVLTGATSHGSTSQKQGVYVFDRSLLNSLPTPQTLSKFRVERHDMVWDGGSDVAYTYSLPWETLPPDDPSIPNPSLDYPDISASHLNCRMGTSGLDASLWPVGLRPSNGNALATSWTAGKNLMAVSVNVPKFQPANPIAGYMGNIYTYIDVSGDGRLQRSGQLGVSRIARVARNGVKAEPYRQFYTGVTVPVDRRVEIEEPTLDVGEVPQGFGLTPASDGTFTQFHPALGYDTVAKVLTPYDSADPFNSSFGTWFKPFTAHNLGNINLRDIFIAKSDLVSDNVQGAGTSYLPADKVVSTLDNGPVITDSSYINDSVYGPVLGLTTRTFKKARVGDTATELKVPDLPVNTSPDISQYPTVSIVAPIGTPAGTYYGKIALEDREAGVWSSNSVTTKVTVTEARMTDGSTAGSQPHVDTGKGVTPSGDMSPAAYLDANGNIYMVWASSRSGDQTSTDPWYLYESELTGAKFTRTDASQPWTWWSAPKRFPSTDSSWAGKTAKFASPSIATDKNNAWLFFSEQAYDSTANNQYKSIAWVAPIAGGKFDESTMQKITGDATMPKYGVRGVSDGTGLWSFWYGGGTGKWRIYYSNNGTPADLTKWTSAAQLTVPKGLTAVAEPMPVFEEKVAINGSAEVGNVINVIYSGYSNFHKDSDIYMSRYGVNGNRLELKSLPVAVDDPLLWDGEHGAWSATGVDWDITQGFTITAAGYEITKAVPTIDKATGQWIYGNEGDFAFPDGKTLRQLFRAVIVDPVAGTVRFLRTPGKDAAVTASYTPRASRLTTDPTSDVAPYAIWDTGQNPRYADSSQRNARFAMNGYSGAPPTDRLWLFWRRSELDKPGSGIHFKTLRYMVQLPLTAPMPKGNVTSPNISSNITGPIEVDWIKNRLYFTSADAGKRVTVTYTDAKGVTQTVEQTVSLQPENASGEGNSFGNLSRVMVNEGQVSAFMDSHYDSNSLRDAFKVWVFWSSTRSGGTDVYYETISPRFYGTETGP